MKLVHEILEALNPVLTFAAKKKAKDEQFRKELEAAIKVMLPEDVEFDAKLLTIADTPKGLVASYPSKFLDQGLIDIGDYKTFQQVKRKGK